MSKKSEKSAALVPDCNDVTLRLCIYQAGHAITAYMLGQKIAWIQMLPRPPMTFTDKPFNSHSWGSFIAILESRVMELFGGQIAEEITCNMPSCCGGDISRIDEITRILDGLYGDEETNSDDVLFDLEDQVQEMFAPQNVRDAILPVAHYLYDQEIAGHTEIDGKAVTEIIEQHIPRPEKKKRGILEMLNLA